MVGDKMDKHLAKAYSEVDTILSYVETKYAEKIPKRIRNIFKEEKLKDYTPNIIKGIPLNEQKLEKKTYAILAALQLNYWCENDEEKQEIIKELSYNDDIKKIEYNNKDYFSEFISHKNVNGILSNHSSKNNELIIENKDNNLFKRILNRIKKFFKR